MDNLLHTRVLIVDPDDPDPHLIARAAGYLRRDGLVAFPTETVYGLGANAFSAQAVARIFQAKQRPASDPLIVHICELSQLAAVAGAWPDLVERLAGQFWPGPLTMVLERHPQIPAAVSAGRATIAVRMPRHPVALALLRHAAVPVAAPSANLFARPSPTTAQHVLDDLRGRIDLVLDAGATSIGLESTVIDLTSAPPVVLRPGGVPLERLQELLPAVRFNPQHLPLDHVDQDVPPAGSPGMLSRHYSPAARLLLFTGPLTYVLAHMYATGQHFIANRQRVGVLTTDEDRAYFAGLPAEIVSLGTGTSLAQIGRNLFAGLRELDQRGVDVILVHGFGQQGLGVAIWDRLFRATEGQVITVMGPPPPTQPGP